MPLDFTDAWHPTVNPSARMPIHHFRHIAILGHHHGILNEFPRLRGGTTIRLTRPSAGRLHLVELPTQLTFAPWWLPFSNHDAVLYVRDIFDAALKHGEPTTPERGALADFRDIFLNPDDWASGDSGFTVGEALWHAADTLYRQLIPHLPTVDLVSLTRSPTRHILAGALAKIPGGLLPALVKWARLDGVALWPLLAVSSSDQGLPLRIRLNAARSRLEAEPLAIRPGVVRGGRFSLTEDAFLMLLEKGRLVPNARLTALAEAALFAQGQNVRHFGNTYGHLAKAGLVLNVPETERIPCCSDNEDSWHFADLPLSNGSRYPLHLIELAACSREAHAAASNLITTSLKAGKPVHLLMEKGIDEAVRSGGT